MERKNNSEDFLQKIFDRSEDPISQLERINSIVPIFFANEKNVVSANKKLDDYGYQINDDYVSEMKGQFQMFGHPSCGTDTGGYGIGHPSCGHDTGGYGIGHPSCCSSKNERCKSLLLVRKNNSGRYNETRN